MYGNLDIIHSSLGKSIKLHINGGHVKVDDNAIEEWQRLEILKAIWKFQEAVEKALRRIE